MKKRIISFTMLLVLGLLLFVYPPNQSIAESSKKEPVMQTVMWLSDPYVNTTTSITYYFDIPEETVNDCCYELSVELPTEWFDTADLLEEPINSQFLSENILVNQKKVEDYSEYSVFFLKVTKEECEFVKGFICVKGFEEEVVSLTVTLGKGLSIRPIKEGTFATRETSIYAGIRYGSVYLHIFPEEMKETIENKDAFIDS